MPLTIPRGDPPTARRLALLYACTFGHLGVVMPFLAPWLAQRGLSAAAIGALLAVPPGFKLLSPWTWGRWADRTGRRRTLFVLALAGSCAALGALTLSPVGGALVGAMVVYGFSRSPLMAFAEATALEQAECGRIDYGPVRLWGSLAFASSAAGYGLVRDHTGADAGLWLAAGLLGLGCFAAARLPRPTPTVAADAQEEAAGSGSIPSRLLMTCALMQCSHGAYYTFYSLHLEALGYGGVTIGLLWALAVVAEILALTRLDRWVEDLGPATVLRGALVLAAVRWLLIGSVSGLAALSVAQLLHAATYAAFHVAAIREVYRSFPPRERTRGQTLYSGMSFGLGLFAGTLVAGRLAVPLGLDGLFYGSAGVALLGLFTLGPTARIRSIRAASGGS